MKREQVAITSVSTQQSGLDEALDAYTASGFRNVEFALPLVKEWMAHDHSIDDVRRLLAAHDMRAIGGFETHLACFAPPEPRRANHDLLRANARLIHDLGGGTMVVGTDGPSQPLPDPLAALDTIADVLGVFMRAIEDLDVTVALEFNWSPVVKSLQSAVRVAQTVNHPRLGVLFDPAHYYTTPTKFAHLTAETVRWIRHVHLNDMRDKPGDLSNCNSDRVLPGEGVLDLPALIARLEQHGYAGLFSIEMFNADLWRLPALEAARLCYQSLAPLCHETEG